MKTFKEISNAFTQKTFKTTKITPAPEAVVTDPIALQTIKVYSKNNPEKVVTIIGNGNIDEDIRNITPADIIAGANYFLLLNEGIGNIDDIDHLGNRRVRSVGELLQNQFRIGLTRMERQIREKMSTVDADTATPQGLINIRPCTLR